MGLLKSMTAGFGAFVVAFAIGRGTKEEALPEDKASRARQVGEAERALPVPTSTPEAPPIVVAAGRLLAEYANNEVAADARYKDRRVEISGLVTRVRKNALGAVFVDVGTGAPFEYQEVLCEVAPTQVTVAAALNKGDRVVLRGRVRGMLMGLVRMANSDIVSILR